MLLGWGQGEIAKFNLIRTYEGARTPDHRWSHFEALVDSVFGLMTVSVEGRELTPGFETGEVKIRGNLAFYYRTLLAERN